MQRALRPILACLVILSLSACAGPPNASSTQPTANSGQATEAPARDQDAAKSTDLDGGKSDIPVEDTLRVEVFDRGVSGQADPTDNFWTDWIKEKFKAATGIDVTFTSVPRSEEVDKLNVLMASSQAPDICFTYNGPLCYNYYKSGGLANLTDAVETYGQDLKAYLGEDVLKEGRYDDGQYVIHAKRLFRGMRAMWIRQDWLDTLGMPVPDSMEAFYNTLVAFKEKNPGGVDPEYLVPLASTYDISWHLGSILEPFYENLSDKELYIYDKSRLIFHPDYKEGVRFLNKLYNEGLLDPEFALIREKNIMYDKVKRGEVGVWGDNPTSCLSNAADGTAVVLTQNVPNAMITPFHAFVNSKGEHRQMGEPPTGMSIIVPKFSKNVGGAVQYLNWMATEGVLYFLQNGVEGTHHTLNEDGLPVKIPTKEGARDNANTGDLTLIVNGLDLGDPQKNMAANALSAPEKFRDVAKQALELSVKDVYTFPSLPISCEADSTYGTTVEGKRDELYAKAVTCPVDQFDSVYDACLQEAMVAGMEEIIKERTELWNELMGD